MQKYFDILGVSPEDSQEKIKKAYRKLAKKYHPDVNQSKEASDRFLQIHEAYHALVGNSHEIFDQVDPFYDEEYELKKELWEFIKRKKEEKEKELQETISKMFYVFNIIFAAALLFNFSLLFDYLLPYQEVADKFISLHWTGDNGRLDDVEAYLKSEGGITLKTETYNYEINVSPNVHLQIADDDTEITHTAIYDKVMKATAINYSGEKISFQPSFSIYHRFIYLIPAMIFISLIYYFSKNDNPNKITFSIILFFILMCQLYIFIVV